MKRPIFLIVLVLCSVGVAVWSGGPAPYPPVPVPIIQGGTGATTAAEAVSNLGFPSVATISGHIASSTNVHGAGVGEAIVTGSGSFTFEGAPEEIISKVNINGSYARIGAKSNTNKQFFLEQNGSTVGGTLFGIPIADLGQLYYDGASGLLIRVATAYPMIFITNGVERMRFDAAGNASFAFPIYASAPITFGSATQTRDNLSVPSQSQGSASHTAALAYTDALTASITTPGTMLIQGASQVASAGATADNQFRTITASGDVFIAPGKRLGVGTSTPIAAVEIATTGYRLRLRANDGTHVGYDTDSAGNAIVDASGTSTGVGGQIVFKSGGVERFRFDQTGNASMPGALAVGGGPALKTKKLTLDTTTTAGASTNVAHGLASATIRSIDCLVIASGVPAIIPPEFSNGEGAAADTLRYSVYEFNSRIYIQLTAAKSAGVLGCSATVVLTYEP